MRRGFKGGAALALIAILAAPVLYADDPPPVPQPPSVRISPPIGVASATPVPEPPQPPSVRIRPPIGTPSDEETPTLAERFWLWLQVRIGPPIG